ncbi:MAG: hypothetical protein WCB90_09705 [Methanosarcina sp.]
MDISIKTNGGLELKIVLSIKNDKEPIFIPQDKYGGAGISEASYKAI